MKKYKISIGTSRIIEAEDEEEALKKFNEEVNECQCDTPFIKEMKKK